jgi:hypothetical protein
MTNQSKVETRTILRNTILKLKNDFGLRVENTYEEDDDSQEESRKQLRPEEKVLHVKVLVGDVDGAKVVLFRQLSRVHEGHQVLRSVRVGPAEDRVQGRVGVGRHQFSCDGDRGCQVGHQIGDEVLDVVDDPRDDVFEGVDDEVAHRDEEVLDAIADRGRDVAPDGGLANVAARRGDQKSDENDRFQSHLVVWREIWE